MFSFEQLGRSLDNALDSLPSFDDAVKTVKDFDALKTIKELANSVSESVSETLDSVQQSIEEYQGRAEFKRLWEESLDEKLVLKTGLEEPEEKVVSIDYGSSKVSVVFKK